MRAICYLGFAALTIGCGSEDIVQGADFDHGTAAHGAGVTPFAVKAYPPPPYGARIGSVIANYQFLGWKDPIAAQDANGGSYDTARLSPVSMADFYDPDGARNTRLLLINVSAVWCPVCRLEYREIRASDDYATYRPKGVEFLSVLFEDANHEPARDTDLHLWGQSYAVRFPMLLDPGFVFAQYFPNPGTPLNILVDTRTMRIVSAETGYLHDLLYEKLDAALAQ
jgi:hypothetical protein